MALGVGRTLVSIVLAGACALGSGSVAHADPARQHLTPKAARLMNERRWVEAAPLLYRIVEQQGTDSQTELELAKLRLAGVLRQLGFPSASFALVSLIASQPRHSMRHAALSELAILVAELPEASEAARTAYALPCEKHRRPARRPRDAAALLARELSHGALPLPGGQACASCRTPRLRRSEKRGVPGGSVPDRDVPRGAAAERCRDSITRAGGTRTRRIRQRRSGAHRSHAARARPSSLRGRFRPIARGELAVDSKNLGLAIKHFGRVDVAGPHAHEALVEQAWAWFVLGQGERALGNLRTLEAPSYAQAFAPDTELLRAAVHWEHCDRAGAAYVLAAYQKRAVTALQESERV